MKKLHSLPAFILVSCLIGSFPLHGMQKAGQTAQKSKEYLVNEFKESIKRLKKCVLKRSCSKGEALKMGRDLLILIGAILGTGYLGPRLLHTLGNTPVGSLAENKEFFYQNKIWKVLEVEGRQARIQTTDKEETITIPTWYRVEPAG